MISAIQFVGTQRSGSNLLRVMLNAHSMISSHHPPHLLQTFMPLLHLYGDLSIPQNKRKLIEDCCEWVYANPVTWQPVSFDINAMNDHCSDLIDIFQFIYKEKAKQDQAMIWACKSTFNIEYIHSIEERIKPFYIYLYRDGRDVAVSFKKAIVGPKHIYAISKKWHEEQQLTLNFLKRLNADRFISISYESLLENPDKILKQLCEKLGIGFESDMLQYYKSGESMLTSQSGHMWENVSKPLIKSNSKKYLNELTDDEIDIFETVAGDSLKALNYQLEGAGKRTINSSEIQNFLSEDLILRNISRSHADPKDLEMRRPHDQLLAQIKQNLISNETLNR